MISTQHIEESLSLSYVNAVVSKTGQVFNVINRDYGVDGSVRRIDSINGKLIDMGAVFDCQLKASKNWSENETEIIYDIKADAYNRLVIRRENSTLPCYLILLCLPKDKKDWLCITENELILKRSCYYYQMPDERTKNTSSVRVKIPKKNLFDCGAVNILLESVLAEESR
jgi:hypothetical protein